MGAPKYAAINTKIRAMDGKFLSGEDYHNLINAKDVFSIVDYLKEQTYYKEVLEDISSGNIRSSVLENILRRSMAGSIDGIIKFFTGEYKKFIFTLYAQFEIEDMKMLARYLYNKERGSTYGAAEPEGAFIGKYSGIDKERLKDISTVKEMLKIYVNSPFKSYINPLIEGEEYSNLFRLEMVLDLGYFSQLSKMHKNLDKQDRIALEECYGVLCDMLNLQCIYRAKKYYAMEPVMLFNYTLPEGMHLYETRIKKLCSAKDSSEIKALTPNEYAFLFRDDLEGDILMERRMERKHYFNLKELVKKYPYSIIQSVAHVYFMDFQIRDIITVIESVRYKLSEEEVKKYLIHYI